MLLATVPVTATAIVLAAYFIHGQLHIADEVLNTHGESTARHLSRACEYGVFAGNPDILRPIVVSALEEDAVVSVTVTDHLGTTIIEEMKSPSRFVGASSPKEDEILSFSHAITLFPMEIDEMDLASHSDSERVSPVILGWVIVKLSTVEAAAAQREAINNSLVITFIGIVLSILLAILFSHKLTLPLSRLTDKVRRIGEGDLDIPRGATSTGEIGTLESGIYGMLHSLRESRGNLQKQIDKATTDLRHSLNIVEQQNIELRTARQDSLLANNAKSTFLANVSHEIRTPLNGILGFARLLKKSGLKSEQADYVDTIEKSATNLLHLIGDILDISKIESGKIDIQDVKFDLKECIEDVITLLAPSAYDKLLDISSVFYDDVPQLLMGAPDRIRQILVNLVGNAIKFSDHGTIIVRTALEDEDEDEDHVMIRISVSDQGIGISQQDKEILFNSFFQLDNSTTRRHSGTGLGLFISKSLAELMGGTVNVDSSEGEGSTFWFTFRAKKTEYSSSDATLLDQPFKGSTALIYDENQYSGIAALHMLRSFGFSMVSCNSVVELNKQIAMNAHIDLVVLGLSKADAIPERLQLLYSTIIRHTTACTLCFINSVDPITLLQVREHGYDACLPKTSRSNEVLQTLKRLLPNKPEFQADDKSVTPADMGSGPSRNEERIFPFETSLSSLKILIAEDNQINAKLLCTILDQAGARSILVSDGKQAVELFTQQNFDVILMDVHMPEKNGVQATAEIRELETGRRRIPIIGLTASVLANERKVYLSAGMDDLLIKPVPIDRLLQTIRYWSTNRNIQTRESYNQQFPHTSHVASNTAEGNSLSTNGALTRTLLDMLLDDIPATREKLQRAFNDKDWDQLGELVHKFLGGLGYCDVPALKSAVENLQNKLHPVTDTLPKALDNVFNEMKWLLDRYRGNVDN